MPRQVQSPQRTTCRISDEKLVDLFSLGELHISDFMMPGQDPHQHKVALQMCLAPKSGLVQLAHTASFDTMYQHYWYKSGTNATMTAELQGIAMDAQKLMQLERGDVFIDIGCNDGTLLSFVDKKITRIGFDPATNNAQDARPHASLIVNDYFSHAAYRKTAHGSRKAKMITSIAMFYDLEDPHAFVRDVERSLDPQGLWIIQMSYLPLMLEQLAFDNICHEHLEYYSLSSLKYLLDQHGLTIVDCQLNDVNGGSFRIYVRKASANPTLFATAPYRDVATYRVRSILSHEKTLKLNDPRTYRAFYRRALNLKKETLAFITAERARGKKIWGYGASTKGNTLLQWFGLDHTLIDGIAERSSQKFGLKTVGTNIPIHPEEAMRKAKPDYLLILPWHFINEFREREKAFLRRGGKFIVPCPRFEIIGA